VNEAKEFLEIARDFKDSKEIMREALSNSWDANAKNVNIALNMVPDSPGKKKLVVKITDDGEGIEEIKVDDFFSLGESHKPFGSIGTKGHGTKIYYKSRGISFTSVNSSGKMITALTEFPPLETLMKGVIPTYRYDVQDSTNPRTYMDIVVDGFDARRQDFADAREIYNYIVWHTIVGSIGSYFGTNKMMDVNLQLPDLPILTIKFGFKFPDMNTDLDKHSTKDFCKVFGPVTYEDLSASGRSMKAELIGAVLGEASRSKILANTSQMGLWLCKDYIRISQKNELIQSVFGGRFYESNMLVFANSQQFSLTANRNDILEDTEEYEWISSEIRKFLRGIQSDEDYKKYQTKKSVEDKEKKDEEDRKAEDQRRESVKTRRQQRINIYKTRTDLNLGFGPLKEPQQEVEVALLLQSMIESKNPSLDFRIGEYNSNYGPDLILESKSKGTHKTFFAEIVVLLENLFLWNHPPEGYEKIICWKIGKVGVDLEFNDGRKAHLTSIGHGRYVLSFDTDNIDVFVLSEILKA
jgi:hypothetical protein